MASQRSLIYVMDPMCSWCWGFAPVLDALARQAAAEGVPLSLRVGGLRREQRALEPASRERILGYWRAVEQASGQRFDFERALPDGLVYDTEPACRALVAVRSLDEALVWPLAQRIQQAFYLEGEDVTCAALLVRLAEQVGVPRIEFADAFDSEAAWQATHADFDWVADLGISGFPTVLAEQRGQLALLTNGYQPLAALQPLLQRWLDHSGQA